MKASYEIEIITQPDNILQRAWGGCYMPQSRAVFYLYILMLLFQIVTRVCLLRKRFVISSFAALLKTSK